MTDIALTIILVVDVEKDPVMTRRFFGALRRLNGDAPRDKVQILALTQRKEDPVLEEEIAKRPVDRCETVYCDHPFVEGYPVWDVMEATRRIWPRVRGRYVTWAHPEFFLCAHRLARTLEFLADSRPHIAIGNLRRPGSDPSEWKFPSCSRDVSDALSCVVDAQQWEMAQAVSVLLPTREWMYWSPPPKAGETRWLEDIFFASKRFLDAVGFLRDFGPLPFQDVYDLMGMVMEQCGKRALRPKVVRLSRETHEAIHLWHPKAWASFTPAMKEYFVANAGKYRNTRLVDFALWDRLIACRGTNMPKSEQPVIQLRRGPGGSVTRFAVGLSEHLNRGGADALRAFYKEDGYVS